MELTGKVIAILPERSGISARGEWHSQSYVIETQEQYPKHLCFDVFGADKIAQFAIQAGEIITVSLDIDAREYNGRWYNSIRGWQVARPGQQPMQPQGSAFVTTQTNMTTAQTSIRFPKQPPTEEKGTVPPATQGKPDDLPF